jgi:hypothetical protein
MSAWLLAFCAMAATDIAWVYSALQAGFWAVAQFLTYTIAVLLCVDKIEMLIPSAAGAFVGTAGGVWMANRSVK